jgi:pimeloyl-ACP methyl ester carboxylesterase
VYFCGLGSKGGLKDCENWLRGTFSQLESEYVFVAPLRPEGSWWFVDDDKNWGWIDGSFQPKLVDAFLAWLDFLAKDPSIDERRVSLLGFSAGAYAVLELLARNRNVNIRGVIIGGVHGHAQADMNGIQGTKRVQRSSEVLRKWNEFLKRVEGLKLEPLFFSAVHNEWDKLSPWPYAQKIYESLRKSCSSLGNVQLLAKQATKGDASAHSYFASTFTLDKLQELLHVSREKCVSKKRIVELEKERPVSKARTAEPEDAMKKVETELKKAKLVSEQLRAAKEAEAKRFEGEASTLKSEILDIEKKAKEAKETATQLEEENRKLKAKCELLQSFSKKISNEALVSQSFSKSQIANLEFKLSAAKAEFEKLRTAKGVQDQELSCLKAKLAVAETSASTLKLLLADTEEKAQAAATWLRELSEAKAVSEKVRGEMEGEVKRCSVETYQAKAKLLESETKAKATETRLSEENDKLKEQNQLLLRPWPPKPPPPVVPGWPLPPPAPPAPPALQTPFAAVVPNVLPPPPPPSLF